MISCIVLLLKHVTSDKSKMTVVCSEGGNAARGKAERRKPANPGILTLQVVVAGWVPLKEMSWLSNSASCCDD